MIKKKTYDKISNSVTENMAIMRYSVIVHILLTTVRMIKVDESINQILQYYLQRHSKYRSTSIN